MSRSLVQASSQYQKVASVPITAYPFTMAIAAYPLDTNTDKVAFFMGTDANNSNAFALAMYDNGLVAATKKDTVFVDAFAGSYAATTWQYLAAVFASNVSSTSYLDGTPGTTDTTADTISFVGMDTLVLGVYKQSTPFGYFSGRLQWPAIWNVALSAAEIQMLAAGLSPLHVRPQSLVYFAPHLGRDTSDIDIIGGRLMTNTGSTASADEPRMILPRRRLITYAPPVATAAGRLAGDNNRALAA